MNYKQIQSLLPEGFKDQKSVMFTQKAFRDVNELRKHARFVIVLDHEDDVNVYCREIIDNSECGYVANVIAVLAPVRLFEGKLTLAEGLVLEIGLSRGRPYTQAEVLPNGRGDRRIYVKPRRKLRDITYPELEAAWSTIVTLLSEATRRLQAGREFPNQWVLHGRDYIHDDGMRISVSRDDKIMYWKVVIEDERTRTRRYLKDRAEWITMKLSPYLGSKVTGKRFKNLKGVTEVAGALVHMRRYTFAPNHLMRKLLSLLPGGVKGIFEEVVDAHKLSTLLGTLQREPKFPAEYLEAQQLGKLKESFFVIKRKQGNAIRRSEDGKKKRQIKPDGSGNAHAQGCVVAEYYFTERRRP